MIKESRQGKQETGQGKGREGGAAVERGKATRAVPALQQSPALTTPTHHPKMPQFQHTAQSPSLNCCREEGKPVPRALTCLKEARTGPTALWMPHRRKEFHTQLNKAQGNADLQHFHTSAGRWGRAGSAGGNCHHSENQGGTPVPQTLPVHSQFSLDFLHTHLCWAAERANN